MPLAMGLGKSLMTIATICALHRQNRGKRFAIVCPSSLVENWAQEFDKWIGKAGQPKRVIIKGGKEGIRQMKAFSVVKPNYQSEVIILSYDLFRINQDCLKDIKKVGLLVVDEGNSLGSRSIFCRLQNALTMPSFLFLSQAIVSRMLVDP
jgi:SNF2 family DNA or RNA helicase